MGTSGDFEPRAVCARCRKPVALCLCDRIQRVSNRTRVLVVQHRRERGHAVGTARIARLGFSKTRVVVAGHRVERPDLMSDAALLYPGPDSRELADLSPAERPSELVVLDGTWNHARRLFLDNPWIQRIPRVRLSPDAPSRYRIRKQPAQHCVSTLESIVAALRILEPETRGFEGLLAAFDAMVDEQQAFMVGPDRVSRFRHRNPRPSRAVPEDLWDPARRTVVVYGETGRADREGPCGSRRILRWSAFSPREGAQFDCLVRPPGGPTPQWHLEHLGVDAGSMAQAGDLNQARQEWNAFRRPQDLYVAWLPATSSLLARLDESQPECLALRSLWANVVHRRPGGLDALVESLDLPLTPPRLPGRAALRLAQAAALLEHLLEIAPRVVYR